MRAGPSLESLILISPFSGAFIGNHAFAWAFLFRPPLSQTWPQSRRSRHDSDGVFRSPRQHVYCSYLPLRLTGGRVRCLARLASSQSSDDSGESTEAANGGSEEDVSTRQGSEFSGSEVDPAGGLAGTDPVQATAAEEGSSSTGDTKQEVEDDGETVFLPTGAGNDVRLFRAKLRAGSEEKWQEQLRRNENELQLGGQDAWAHELSFPEKGCLIVAKSNVFSVTQTYFNEAVIFLASHDENGSAGIILNRPTTMRLGDLLEGDALPQFRENPLYMGGDVGEGNVQIIHPFGPDQLAGAMEIIPGVCIGGTVEEADRVVATGRAKREDFRFFLHLCGWAPGQLESEIQKGVWFPAATSSNVILKHCIQLPVPLWREVMTLMGPKYGLLARDTYDDL